MKGLLNKVLNRPTRRRYLVSTIRQGPEQFETAVFEAVFFSFPLPWRKPILAVKTCTRDEAWDLHHRLASRLATEYPPRVFQEFTE